MTTQSSPLMSLILSHYCCSVKVNLSQHVFLLALDCYIFNKFKFEDMSTGCKMLMACNYATTVKQWCTSCK